MSETALILLAAGSASRMGQAKQLLEFGGQPMVRHAAATALRAGCSPVIVVIGAHGAEVREALRELPVELVENPRWAEGMGTSIQAGLRALNGREASGAILALADQPFVSHEFLRRLTDEHTGSAKAIIASRYSGTVGVPVFFSHESLGLLERLKPAEGCKGVILGNAGDVLLLDCPEAATDIDTPEDYARIAAIAAATPREQRIDPLR